MVLEQKEEASLWMRLIVAIYGLEENGWSTKDPNTGKSYRLWADILKHKETFFKFSAFVLRNQNQILEEQLVWRGATCRQIPYLVLLVIK